MLTLKNAILLLPILAIFGNSLAADLSEYQIRQLCVGKSMEVIAYPGDEHKFILCLSDGAQVGNCRSEKDPLDATATVQTCFNERKQSCSLDSCKEADDPTDYEEFVNLFCKDDNNWLARLPAEDCEHFYICLGSSNDHVKQSCADGLHYSRVSKTCEKPLEANCQSLDSMCKDKATGYRFASQNCYEYYECRLKKPVIHSCPYGEHYDVTSKRCISASNSKCIEQTNRPPICKTNDNGLYLKHPKCNKFYICLNTVPLEAQCPQEFFFDEKNQMCRKDTNNICLD